MHDCHQEKKNKVVVFVQARMGSTRLPGKVMKKVLGKEILLHHIARIRMAKTVDEAVVITTTNSNDDQIAELCEDYKILYYRGSENDLLDRHYQAAKIFKADLAVKIPSDSPFSDPAVIDEVLNLYLENPDKYDYVSNFHPPTFPDGLDVEGFTFEVLEKALKEATKPHEREHTTPFIWDQPDRFRIGNVLNPRGNMFMTHRWTLDYPEDFEFIKSVLEYFKDRPDFSTDDILEFLRRHPKVADINKKYNGVNWYRNVPGELKTVDQSLYKEEPK